MSRVLRLSDGRADQARAATEVGCPPGKELSRADLRLDAQTSLRHSAKPSIAGASEEPLTDRFLF